MECWAIVFIVTMVSTSIVTDVKALNKQCGIPGVGTVNQLFAVTKSAASSGKLSNESFKLSNAATVNLTLIRSKNVHSSSQRHMGSNKIVGGFVAATNQFCWQAMMLASDFTDSGESTKFQCAGTIIGAQTILTAASCVTYGGTHNGETLDPSVITIMVGTMDNSFRTDPVTTPPPSSGCRQNYNVARVTRHPAYDPVLFNNDIAILTLTTPIQIDNKPCACTLCLRDTGPKVNETCIVNGEGLEHANDSIFDHIIRLKWVPVAILKQSLDDCFHVTSDDGLQTTDLSGFICAGNVGREDSCAGDSGGPLACLDSGSQSLYLAGVVSFGESCTSEGKGAQYSKVQSYLNWIRANSLPGDVTIVTAPTTSSTAVPY